MTTQSYTVEDLNGMDFSFEEMYDLADVKFWRFGRGTPLDPEFLISRIENPGYQAHMEAFHRKRAGQPGQRQEKDSRHSGALRKAIKDGLEKHIVPGLRLGSGKIREEFLTVSDPARPVNIPAGIPVRLLEISLRGESGGWDEPLGLEDFEIEDGKLRLVTWIEETPEEPEAANGGEEDEAEPEEPVKVCKDRPWPVTGPNVIRLRHWENLVIFDPVNPKESTITRAQLAVLIRRFLLKTDFYDDVLRCAGAQEDYLRKRLTADEKNYAAAFSGVSGTAA